MFFTSTSADSDATARTDASNFEESWLFRTPARILLIALAGRVLAVGLSIPRVNPYSQADAITFSVRARQIADGELAVTFPSEHLIVGPISVVYPGIPPTQEAFGLLVSPFWLLPGPSLLYARLALAGVGVLAVYNVYAIAAQWHSHRAGVIATLPFLFFSSIVLAHGALLRESLILFGLTTAGRAYLAPPAGLSLRWRGLLVLGGLGLASFLRTQNMQIYALLAVFGALYYLFYRSDRVGLFWTGTILGAVGSFVVARPLYREIFDWLAGQRVVRATGTTAFLTGIEPNTLWKAIVLGPILTASFYLVPFPWMVESPLELALVPESLGNLVFIVAAAWGARSVGRRRPVAITTLVVGFLAFSFLYGLVDGNVGAAIRHRQMFTWVVYSLGAVAIADRFRIVV